MQFTKMHGAGNDYVYVDCFSQQPPNDVERLARSISDRHFGVGADGLILIFPPSEASGTGVDAEMRMYNADGSPSEMCGNGIRCVAKYVYERGHCPNENLRIASAGQTLDLQLAVSKGEVQSVRVDMGAPILNPIDIPSRLRPTRHANVIDAPLAVAGGMVAVTTLSMGNPHCVVYVEQADDDLVQRIGPQIETHEAFPNRVNVEFVEVQSRSRVRQRTWERGSGETMACGTGASAVCVAGVLTGQTDRNLTVELLGGILELEWNSTDDHVYMTGPAIEVFTGEWPD